MEKLCNIEYTDELFLNKLIIFYQIKDIAED